MALILLRTAFVLVASGIAVFIIFSGVIPPDDAWAPWQTFGGVLLLSIAVIAIDMLIPRKQFDTISAVYFGLIVGLFLAYVVGLAMTPLLPRQPPGRAEAIRCHRAHDRAPPSSATPASAC